MSKEKLYEAFEEEAKHIDVEALMEEMLNSYQEEKGQDPTRADELQIRKMILARMYEQKEASRLIALRDSIVQEWNERINKKLDNVKGINEYIENWIKESNKEQKLALDIATATLKRSAPKAKVKDKDKAREYLKEHNQLESFLKPAELDTTLLQNAYKEEFNKLVKEEAEARIEKAKEEGKVTKKKEKEITLQVERELADDYFSNLPDFLEYIPEKKSLSITMK